MIHDTAVIDWVVRVSLSMKAQRKSSIRGGRQGIGVSRVRKSSL